MKMLTSFVVVAGLSPHVIILAFLTSPPFHLAQLVLNSFTKVSNHKISCISILRSRSTRLSEVAFGQPRMRCPFLATALHRQEFCLAQKRSLANDNYQRQPNTEKHISAALRC